MTFGDTPYPPSKLKTVPKELFTPLVDFQRINKTIRNIILLSNKVKNVQKNQVFYIILNLIFY